MNDNPLNVDGNARERGRLMHRNLWLCAISAALVPVYCALRARRSPGAEG